MTQDAIAPTPEQLKRGFYEPPVKDQQTNRTTWRKKNIFEELHNRGDIEFHQLKTAEQLERHMHGSAGADVRFGDEHKTSDPDMVGGLARAHHAKELARAEKALLPKEWNALTRMVLTNEHPEVIGREMFRATDRQIARARGVGLVCSGLERLSVLWGKAGK